MASKWDFLLHLGFGERWRCAATVLRRVSARLPPGELGDVIADVLAALAEAFELGIGEVESVDLLDALGADHAGQRREDALFAILAAHEGGCGKHGVLVVQHGGADSVQPLPS